MFGIKKKLEEPQDQRMSGRDYDRLMGRVYRMVGCHRDSDAIQMLIDEFDYLQTRTHEFEALYKHVEQWGNSRTLLCLGRLIIYKLDREKRFEQVLHYIEKCQGISPMFVLPELSRVTFFARQAIDAGKLSLAKNLVVDHAARYGDLVGSGECDRILKLIDPDIDVTSFRLGE